MNFSVPLSYLYPPIKSVVSRPRQFATASLAVLSASVPGDFVETGVFTGGMSVVMARVARGERTGKTHWACDSFSGLPSPQKEDFLCTRHKGRASCKRGEKGSFSSSASAFRSYVQREGLTNVRVVEGWFHSTLPPPGLSSVSFLRLDGDVYNSTLVTLVRLYPLVSSGGFVYVDDYGSFAGCSRAVDEYFVGSPPHLHKVFETNGKFEAVWFKKP